MSYLRILEIPANPARLDEGTWLHWGELRMWLLDRNERMLANEIERQILHGREVEATERRVRI